MTAPRPADGATIDRALSEILAADEYATARQAPGAETQAIGEMFDALVRAAQSMIGALRADHPELFVVVLVGSLSLVTLAVWLGVRAVIRRGGARVDEVSAPVTPFESPAALAKQARALADQGAYTEALRLLFRSAILQRALQTGVLADHQRAERFRRARTYGELVAEFARSSDEAATLRSLTQELERGVYGDAPISAEQYRAASRRIEAWR